jgi:hypothetical protein
MMIVQENEVIMLILTVGVLAAILINQEQLKTMPSSELLLISFVFFTLAAIFTNLEAVFWPGTNNLLEHLSLATCAFFIFIWCLKIGRNNQ